MGKLLSIFFVALTLISVSARAELAATPLSGDARLVTFDIDPDNTYLILTKPRAVTHLEFPEGEKITTLAAGDTTNWEFTPTKDRRHLFVRARIENSTTSMTVITDKRSFQFVVKATADGSKWYQRVTWRVPQTLLLDQEPAAVAQGEAPNDSKASLEESSEPAVNPADLKFNYVVEGAAPFKPTSVFDDGKMTWIRMPHGLQELPVVFALDDSGEYMLVNYVVKQDFLLVQRVVERMVLKIGKAEVKLSKAKKKSWFGSDSANDSAFQRGLYGN